MQQEISSITLPALKLALVALAAGGLLAATVQAQNLPITAGQKATAAQVAQSGVPLADLAPAAPDSYVVKSGDTLWAIAGLFLKTPWRWPELWGMNLEEIKNPHLIFPGQQLYLERKDGRARLRSVRVAADSPPTETIRVSPRTRFEGLDSAALPTLKYHLIAPFLAEPIIVDENGLKSAPRIVATQDGRVVLARGDRVYALGQSDKPLLDAPGKQQAFRIFREVIPLKDPVSGEVLGYEAQYVGKALLVRSQSVKMVTSKDGKESAEVTPATVDIGEVKLEVEVGDRMLPEPERELLSYSPRAPSVTVDARIVSLYGQSVQIATQNQVVVINRGLSDGIQRGDVLAILKDGARVVDKTDVTKPVLKLPDERNGLLMVFRPFDRLSYALVLEVSDGVRVGDRLTNPR